MIIVDVVHYNIDHDHLPIPGVPPSPSARSVPCGPRAPRLHAQTVSVRRLTVQHNVRPDLTARSVHPERGSVVPSWIGIVPTCIIGERSITTLEMVTNYYI